MAEFQFPILPMDQHNQSRQEIKQRLCQLTFLFVNILLSATVTILNSVYGREREPYHTSVLTGEAWVLELLNGHPECIRCELGVHRHVFVELISELRAFGHDSSKYVSLEEQLAIFLYCCVTGLTVRHTGERFQRANETVSR
jgi:phosphate starvation-inducible membrane PsiE